MNVKEILEQLFSIMSTDNDNIRKTYDLGTCNIKLVVNPRGVKLVLNRAGKPAPKKSEDPEALECVRVRKEFHEYLDTIDNATFIEACKSLGNEMIRHLDHDIEANNYDLVIMEKAVLVFKEAIDNVIQEKISELKSRMSYVPTGCN